MSLSVFIQQFLAPFLKEWITGIFRHLIKTMQKKNDEKGTDANTRNPNDRKPEYSLFGHFLYILIIIFILYISDLLTLDVLTKTPTVIENKQETYDQANTRIMELTSAMQSLQLANQKINEELIQCRLNAPLNKPEPSTKKDNTNTKITDEVNDVLRQLGKKN